MWTDEECVKQLVGEDAIEDFLKYRQSINDMMVDYHAELIALEYDYYGNKVKEDEGE